MSCIVCVDKRAKRKLQNAVTEKNRLGSDVQDITSDINLTIRLCHWVPFTINGEITNNVKPLQACVLSSCKGLCIRWSTERKQKAFHAAHEHTVCGLAENTEAWLLQFTKWLIIDVTAFVKCLHSRSLHALCDGSIIFDKPVHSYRFKVVVWICAAPRSSDLR